MISVQVLDNEEAVLSIPGKQDINDIKERDSNKASPKNFLAPKISKKGNQSSNGSG